MKKEQVYNPYLPSWEYVPDGEPRVFGDRVYVYGSHDRFNAPIFCVNDYVCWSAPIDDLSDWRYEGIIYRKNQDPKNKLGLRLLFAPDVVQGKDGRYYLYYAFDFYGMIGVAVCDEPAGKYEFYGWVSYEDGTIWGRKKGDQFPFDPGVLVDDDGRVFLYSGFYTPCPAIASGFKKLKNDGGVVVELSEDMKTIQKAPKLLFPKEGLDAFQDHEFFEASSIRKDGDRYIFVYSSRHNHELCYAVSKRPDGGFTYGGTLVDLGDLYMTEEAVKANMQGLTDTETNLKINHADEFHASNYLGNTHGGMLNIEGQWYIFYHRHTNRHGYSRQACAERLIQTEDGRFLQAEVTSCIKQYNSEIRSRIDYEIAGHFQDAVKVIASEIGLVLPEDRSFKTSDLKGHMEFFWLRYIEDTALQLLSERSGQSGISFSCAELCEKTWRIWTAFMAEKFIDFGKAVFHFAIPDLNQAFTQEGIAIGPVLPQHAKGITSFDYERIKAEESLSREIAEYLIFAINNFANSAAKHENRLYFNRREEKEDTKDILMCRPHPTSNNGNNIVLYQDFVRRMLHFFGGADLWKETEVVTSSNDVLFNAIKSLFYELRNTTFHYTGKANASLQAAPVVKTIFNLEYKRTGAVYGKKYYSNNVPYFYSDTTIKSIFHALYQKKAQRPAQVPSFANVMPRSRFRKELLGEFFQIDGKYTDKYLTLTAALDNKQMEIFESSFYFIWLNHKFCGISDFSHSSDGSCRIASKRNIRHQDIHIPVFAGS